MRTISDDMPERARNPRHLPPDLIEKMRAMREAGMSIESIARKTNVAKSAVHRHTVDINVDKRKDLDPPPDWLPEAQALIAAGMTANQVAQRLSLHSSRVYRVLAKFNGS